eukprot:7390261-Prymnesium_polylepis.2
MCGDKRRLVGLRALREHATSGLYGMHINVSAARPVSPPPAPPPLSLILSLSLLRLSALHRRLSPPRRGWTRPARACGRASLRTRGVVRPIQHTHAREAARIRSIQCAQIGLPFAVRELRGCEPVSTEPSTALSTGCTSRGRWPGAAVSMRARGALGVRNEGAPRTRAEAKQRVEELRRQLERGDEQADVARPAIGDRIHLEGERDGDDCGEAADDHEDLQRWQRDLWRECRVGQRAVGCGACTTRAW